LHDKVSWTTVGGAQALACERPSTQQRRRDLLSHVQPQLPLLDAEVVAREGAFGRMADSATDASVARAPPYDTLHT
jgi:hypothetical protein